MKGRNKIVKTGSDWKYHKSQNSLFKNLFVDFPSGAMVKNLPAIAGHTGSIPGPGRSHMLQSN